jgi:hypothetical protein
MNSPVPARRKLLELCGMLIIVSLFYLIYPVSDGVILFILGFVWNWSASVGQADALSTRRYRFSMLKTVLNFQNFFLKPFRNAPVIIRLIIASLPAGIFWGIVIQINESLMPWWATFLGSLVFEVSQLDLFQTMTGQKKS